jgi:pyrroline-5-carboxylate reductase
MQSSNSNSQTLATNSKLPVIKFLGAGNMANSLIRGMTVKGAEKAFTWAVDIIVLAVKPQVMKIVCAELKTLLSKRSPLFISTSAGITASHLSQWLGANTAIVRCMPNAPALVGKGVSVLYASEHANETQKEHRTE